MANPFVGYQSQHTPTSVTDTYGDDYYHNGTAMHVASLMLVALLVITAMKLAGFRAMVGIGRG